MSACQVCTYMNAKGAQVCVVCRSKIFMQEHNQPSSMSSAVEASTAIMSSAKEAEASSRAHSLDAVFDPHFQDEIVKLNVGGEIFVTYKSTLVGINGDRQNYFALLFSQNKAALLDENGAFFIDRDPAYFKCILQYLRTGVLSTTRNMLPALLHLEFKFYGLHFPTATFPPKIDLQFIVDHFEIIESPHSITLELKKGKCGCSSCRNGLEIKISEEKPNTLRAVSVTTPVSKILTAETLDWSNTAPPVVLLDSNFEINDMAKFLPPRPYPGIILSAFSARIIRNNVIIQVINVIQIQVEYQIYGISILVG